MSKKLKDQKIYVNGKRRPISEALILLTEEFILNGESCCQTEIDLVGALKLALKES